MVSKYKKIEIEWYDAVSRMGWMLEDKLPALSLVQTRGYLVQQSKDAITICSSVIPDPEGDEFGDCITIPKKWLKVK